MVCRRWLHLGVLLVVAWFVMTITHEMGHVLMGWWSGARLVELKLWGLPHSFYEPDPRPGWTLWGGPALGVLVPVGGMLLVEWLVKRGVGARRFADSASAWRCGLASGWFVADFCLLSNGVYLALAWLSGNPALDTAKLLAAGVWPGWIVGYCVVTIGVGYVRFRRDVGRVLSGGGAVAEDEEDGLADAP